MIGKLTFLSGIYEGKEFYFKNVLTLGRSPSNDVQLPFPSVSREHARISVSGGSSEIKDLKSNNGTFVNGKIVSERNPLSSGDKIRISNFEMEFELLDENSVDPKRLRQKVFEKGKGAQDTATGFIDIKGVNLSDIEKQIRG